MGDAKRRGTLKERQAAPKGDGWKAKQSNKRTTKLTTRRVKHAR